MTDIRARLADALLRHAWACSTCNYKYFRNDNQHLADVLLSLPGIAIVELPAQTIIPTGWGEDCIGAWPAGSASRSFIDPVSAWPEVGNEVALPDGDFISAQKARALAAALLAAANAVEQSP